MAAAKPTASKHSSTTDDDHVAAAIQISGIDAFQHPFDDVNIILDSLSARAGLDVSDEFENPPHVEPRNVLIRELKFGWAPATCSSTQTCTRGS